MASPQTDNGYAKIANELLDALCAYRLPGEQRQCLDVVFRKTYGWNKKSDAIALSQFVEMTGIKKQNVVRALNGLLSKRLITVIKKDNTPAHIYEITKDYSKWVPLSKKITLSKKIKTVIKKDNLPLSKKSTTKDTTTKDTTKENFELFWKEYPNKKCGKANTLKSWNKVEKKIPQIDDLLRIISKHKKSQDWTKENGQYIPMATTWLNQNRWDAETTIDLSATRHTATPEEIENALR